ncbi:class GN sortase [Zavarzinia sp. CC-PAN008]|uniref:class GN sortase n=1 Tax=Zavarzinia sp. CC-PAN008 TaxID=3243332 RepID=UPI003F744237
MLRGKSRVPPPPSPIASDGGGSKSRIGIAALALLGLILLAQGLYIPVKAIVAQVLLEQAFAESLATGDPVRPWPWADTVPVARLSVPRLGESAIVLAGSSGQALAFGPALVEGSAKPGDPGTAVLAAHRDTHFAFLRHVAVGDLVDVTRGDGGRATFRVTGTRIVRWDASGLVGSGGPPRLVLATCWPFDSLVQGPYRYVVEAEQAS